METSLFLARVSLLLHSQRLCQRRLLSFPGNPAEASQAWSVDDVQSRMVRSACDLRIDAM